MARLALSLTLSTSFLLAFATPAEASGNWVWPVRGEVITSYRNGSDPYAAGQHRGVDIAAPVGRAVVAPVSGRVTFAGTAGSSGLTVAVRSGDGRWDTSYLHLSATGVRKGESVRAGQWLGAVGTTGRRSAAQPHLHFGVREAGSRHAYHDPLDFLLPLRSPGEGKPGPAPAALPLPVKVDPRSAPVPAVRRAPAPSLSPRPHGVPAPVGAPGRAPAPVHAASAVASAIGHTAPAARQPRSRAHDPVVAPALKPRQAPSRAPAAAPAAHGRVAGSREGFDLGWLLACVGLAAAGVCLGRPGEARHAAQQARARVFRRWRTTSPLRSTT